MYQLVHELIIDIENSSMLKTVYVKVVTYRLLGMSASRALGPLKDKYKVQDGMPYNMFTKLFDSVV